MGHGKRNADSEDQVAERHDSWESDVPSTATNPVPLLVKIAGSCGLVACLLLIWHFAFAEPAPVAPATATFVTQPPLQPVVPIQPVTPVPFTPQPSTTSVTPLVQSAPPKPFADWKGWATDAPPPAIAPFDAAQAKQHQEAWAKHLGVPIEYSNSIGMKFRLIPPGEFLMGCTAKELGETIQPVPAAELQTEAPQHKVVLTEAFYLGAHEVTQQQYQAVMNLNPSYFTRTGGGKAAVGDVETSDLPVDSVSWMDAMQFCTQLSEREKLAPFDLRRKEIKPDVGNGYRLPTEAQWEFACRAGTQTRYWTGDSDIDVRRAGVFTSRATRKVGQLAANPFGLFDVHGNVWEWCLDGWNPSAYLAFRDEIAVDPLTPWNLGSKRVVGRGAHFYYGPGNGRSARRGNAPQTLRYLDNGFRAALSVEAVTAARAKPVQGENAGGD